MIQMRIDVIARYMGQDYINTFMYYLGSYTGPLDPSTGLPLNRQETLPGGGAAELRDLFKAAWETKYTNLVTSEWAATELRLTSLSPFIADRYVWSYPLTWVGTAAPPGLPPGQATVVTRRPNPGQRRGNGRVYLGCFPLADTASGVVTPASGTEGFLNAFAAQLSVQLVDPLGPVARFNQSWTPCVINFRARNWPFGAYVAYGFGTQPAVAKMQLHSYRRRRPGHGRTG